MEWLLVSQDTAKSDNIDVDSNRQACAHTMEEAKYEVWLSLNYFLPHNYSGRPFPPANKKIRGNLSLD